MRGHQLSRWAGARTLTAFLLVVCAEAVRPVGLGAEDPQRLNLDAIRSGSPALPLLWKPYSPATLAPVDLSNGAELARRLADGALRLSLDEFLQLVVENDLDLLSARYDFVIAEADVLRARSGQAARGVASAPLPAAVFAGAIGAGVSTTAPLSAGGTGGAAISTAGKLVSIGPRGVFDPTLNVNLSYDHVVSPLNTTRVAGVPQVIVPSTVLQTRFQQQLSWGTSYSVSFNLQRQLSTQAGLLFNPALTSYGSFQVYQPLLNGFGLPLTQRFVTLADNNTKIVREAFHSNLNTILSNAANAYWDLVALRENSRAAAEALAAAGRQHDEDLERVDIGVASQLDALASESAVASARLLLLQAETAVQQQSVVVKTFISKRPNAALDAAALEPTEALPGAADVEVPAVEGSIASALASRSSIRQARLSIQNQRVAVEYTRKNLLPVLSLYFQGNVYGLAPGADPALKQLVRWSYPEFATGFTLTFPVFNRAAQADDVRARLESQESEVTLRRTEQQVTLQVRTASLTMGQSRAAVDAADRALVASQASYAGEQERLRAGISTPYRVLLAQRDVTAAQSADVQARANLAKAVVAYDLAVGRLLERHRVDSAAAERGTLWTGRQ